MADKGAQVYREEMLSLTTYKEWETFANEIKDEIYNNQCAVLENSKTWDQVVYAKGWNACLAYILNLRARIITEITNEQENQDADV